MAVIINASTSTGLVQSADTSGVITLQNNGTNALTVDSGNLQFNSGYGSVATAYGCRAWVNFNGNGTPAIRASGNVTSITDNGTGDYTVNFTNAMPDANYSFTSSIDWGNTAFGASTRATCIVSLATTNARMRTGYLDASAVFTAEDEAVICVAVFR